MSFQCWRGGRSMALEAYLLQYFMDANIQRKVVVNRQDRLMTEISGVISSNQKTPTELSSMWPFTRANG